jgi:hypothetical protein
MPGIDRMPGQEVVQRIGFVTQKVGHGVPATIKELDPGRPEAVRPCFDAGNSSIAHKYTGNF